MVRQDGLFRRVGPWGGRGISALAFAAAIAVFAAPQSAHAQCQYEVTAIITPDDEDACWPFPPSNTFARGMNEKGEVVGYYKPCAIGNERAFFWSEDTGFVTLPTPAGINIARASDINDDGVIIGVHNVIGEGHKGFVFDPRTESYTYLEPLHTGIVATFVTTANAINNSGLVAGSRVISRPGEPIVSNAVIWDTKTNEVTDLSVGVGSSSSEGRAIDAQGITAGLTGPITSPLGFSSDGSDSMVLPPLPGGATSFVNAMNDLGMLVGGGAMNEPEMQSQPALWKDDKWTGLGVLPGAHAGGARAINNVSQVGGSCAFSGVGQRAFLWQLDKMYDLNDLLIETDATAHRVFAMNHRGQIVVEASLPGGDVVGALLAPMNSPMTDLNFDCRTSVHDLLILVLDHWGPCATDDCPAEFTGDGVVDVFDLLVLLANWG